MCSKRDHIVLSKHICQINSFPIFYLSPSAPFSGLLRSDQFETSEVLQRCASQLDSHLQTIKRGTALELAEAMDRVYTSSWALKIMFIRAERYRPVEAAERLVRFFELKKELFGTKLLTTDILLEHLNPDDIEALRSGGLQICPVKDVAGRPIISIMLAIRKYKAAENMVSAQKWKDFSDQFHRNVLFDEAHLAHSSSLASFY